MIVDVAETPTTQPSRTFPQMSELFDGYEVGGRGAYDEVFSLSAFAMLL